MIEGLKYTPSPPDKRYSGIQPQYFPRLHYFARILNADLFAIRDDAQFVRKHKYPDGSIGKSYQAHTPIKQSFGVHLLDVPTEHHGFQPLTQTRISYNPNWVDVHLRTLQIAYSKSPNFPTLYPEIFEMLHSKYSSLAELSTTTILWGILRLLDEERVSRTNLSLAAINQRLSAQDTFRLKDIRLASASDSLKQGQNLTANEKIVTLCREFGANEDYCGGTGVAAYVDHQIFARNGIKITVQDWKCQAYPQLFTKQLGFIPNLSIIDLLMNVPAQEAARIING